MANEQREFSFTTRRFSLGETNVALGDSEKPAAVAHISSETNVYFDNETVVPDLIPDREQLLAHYDFSKEDGSLPITDQSGNGYSLGGQYTGVSESINGLQAGDFNGSGDSLYRTVSDQSQPNTIYIVVRVNEFSSSGGNGSAFFDSTNSTGQLIRIEGDGPYWNLYAGDEVDGPSGDSTNHVISALFNGSNSILRIDGQQVATSNVGGYGLEGITLGSRGNQTNFANCALGEVLVYPQDKSGIFTDVESYLGAKWGISV